MSTTSTTTSTTTGVISGSIKWTGLASGTDFAAVVDKLVAIESRTITRQETWKAEWTAKIQAISDLNTRLVSLKLDAESKDISSELLSRKSTISDESMMSVINTSTAALGSYEVTVGTNIPEKLASQSYYDNLTFGTAGETLTIQIGDDTTNTLTVDVVSGSASAGQFLEGGSMAALSTAINEAAALQGKSISSEVISDKTTSSGNTQRLVLTSLDGGSANRMTIVNEITDLNLTKNNIDKPVNSTFLGSNVVVTAAGTYEGTVNKTITFVAGATGTLGTDDIEIQWADTEGHTGKFTITAAEYAADPTKQYEILQGVKVSFAGPDSSTPARFVKAESFTIDCQTPVLQKGQDNGLAQTAKVVHSGFVDQISPIQLNGAGVFQYRYQGVLHSVTVSDRMSLGNLVSAINAASDNPGVTASVINDGQGTSTSYHLVLTGNHTGAESTIEILDSSENPNNPSQMNMDATDFTVAREASNAMLKVDGFPAGDDNWIQRSSNEVSDVIDGVVVTVLKTGTSTLTVSNDHEAMRDKILQLVQSVNFCKTFILENTKWGESNLEVGMTESGEITTTRENANGLMIGNYGFQIAQTKLDAFMLGNIVPISENPELTTKEKLEKREKYFEDNGLVYTTLSDIGITSDPDNQGLYKVEESKLLTCIQQNPEAVIKLFTFSDEYVDTGSDGKPKTVTIRGAALALAEDMALLTSTTDITDDQGNVVQQGKGIMVTLQENYQAIVENINAKIAREERRIEQVKQRYTDRFNRLEVALQELQDKQTQLESSLSSLDSSSD
ncbi:MAG: flagellar filament capping protein FliD [Deltaproteobacteria bacterium]|jgi:flagellar hook-associated protein 2|nr:flagellar filament capping protein FliD [Deltaproteobacteria bacterium]